MRYATEKPAQQVGYPRRSAGEQCSGGALPLTLMLLAVMSVATTALLRGTAAGLRTAASMHAADRAFAAAANQLEAGLREVTANPALLPVTGGVTLPTANEPGLQVHRELRLIATGSCSAPSTGTRHDYELRVTAQADRGGYSHQRLRFVVCRSCVAQLCAENLPTRGDWVTTDPAAQ